VAKAVSQLHRVGIIHVDLNPMNILHRAEKGRPVIRIVDFESSYEATRYSDVNPDRRPESMQLFQDALTAHLEHIWPGRS
jgi:tRNA A-37 threonylcarbamoyl transferase component Bud32